MKRWMILAIAVMTIGLLLLSNTAIAYEPIVSEALVDYKAVKQIQAEKQAEIARLEAEKEAKALRAQKLASKKSYVRTDTKVVQITGNKLDWLAQSGIAESDWGYVDYIFTKESGWQVTVWNKQGSGAYGLCQAKPGSKMASAGSDYMTNPITQLRWCNSYAHTRYGSWANAYQSHLIKGWW